MARPRYLVVELTPKDRVWVDLKDFDACSQVGLTPDGANVYHAYAKQRLREMGVPVLLVESGRCSEQH